MIIQLEFSLDCMDSNNLPNIVMSHNVCIASHEVIRVRRSENVPDFTAGHKEQATSAHPHSERKLHILSTPNLRVVFYSSVAKSKSSKSYYKKVKATNLNRSIRKVVFIF